MKTKLTPYLVFKKDFEKEVKTGKIISCITPERVRTTCPKLEKGILCFI
jgi:hypothetical protein